MIILVDFEGAMVGKNGARANVENEVKWKKLGYESSRRWGKRL